MAQARRRVARSPRGGGGRSWWWLLLLLVLIGAGVVAARSMARPRAETPRSAEPTLVTAAPAATSPPVARAFRAVVTPSVPSATLAPARTTAPTRPPVAAPRTPSVASATPTSDPSRSVAKPTSTPSVGGMEATAARPAVEPTPTRGTSEPIETSSGRVSTATASVSVALTFDAGADRGHAEDILDLLEGERVVASFGITGQWARANPDLVRRMAADGHLVFNHTLDHRSFTGLSDQLGGLSAARRRAELEDADAILAPLIGHSTRPYYRLPYGDDDAHVAADVLPAGYAQKIGWTIDSLGWRGTPSADIVARCLKLAAPGAIYVFHVGRTSQDALALPPIIQGLRERGFGFRRAD